MRLAGFAALCILGATSIAAAASARGAPDVSQGSIAGIRLGMTLEQVSATLGRPVVRSIGTFDNPGQPERFTRVAFPKRKVAVYFERGKKGAIIVTTWNRAHGTVTGIGPCSATTRLATAYRTMSKPSRFNTVEGKVYGYTIGNHLFAAADGRPPKPSNKITAIALYDGTSPGANKDGGIQAFASFVALSEENCR